MPKECPICGSPVAQVEGEVAIRCLNLSCPAILKESIFHFASKGGLDIDGLGPKLIDQLIDSGLVTNPADLFKLTHSDLVGLERMADKSAQNLLNAIEKAKRPDLARLIFALGIRHVGEHRPKTPPKKSGPLRI
jgi:DNA ligase (NAD+)